MRNELENESQFSESDRRPTSKQSAAVSLTNKKPSSDSSNMLSSVPNMSTKRACSGPLNASGNASSLQVHAVYLACADTQTIEGDRPTDRGSEDDIKYCRSKFHVVKSGAMKYFSCDKRGGVHV